MPNSKRDAHDHSNESNTVVETWTIVSRLGVKTDSQCQDESHHDRSCPSICQDPVVECRTGSYSTHSDEGAEKCTEDDVEEAMHTTVHASDADRCGVCKTAEYAQSIAPWR